MRIIFSFFLALFIYSSIIFFFLYVILNQKTETVKTVYIHHVIMLQKKQTIPKPVIKKVKHKKVEVKITKKKVPLKTKDNFSKAGKDIKIDDIFSTVEANIPTIKIKQKKQENMTKKVSKDNTQTFKKEISKLKTTEILKITNIRNIKGKTKDKNYLETQLSNIWEKIITNQNDFVDLQINIENGVLNFVVIGTNLDTIRLNQFLLYFNKIDIRHIKQFNGIVTLKTKLKE